MVAMNTFKQNPIIISSFYDEMLPDEESFREIEVNIELNDWIPYVPQTYEQPEEGGYFEDVRIREWRPLPDPNRSAWELFEMEENNPAFWGLEDFAQNEALDIAEDLR